MTRQDFVIKVAKINKILGELKYGIDIDTILDFSFLTPQLLMLAEWTADIQQYISQEPSPFPCTANYKHRIYRRNKKVSGKTQGRHNSYCLRDTTY